MGRVYNGSVKGRRNRNYTDEAVEKALQDIGRGRLTLRKAAEKYGIPKSTLAEKNLGKKPGKYGRPTALTEEEERYLVEGLLKCAEWGFPLRPKDVRIIVKSYLDQSKKKITSFKDNLPGVDWVRGLINRHETLSVRLCENIKRCRSAINRDMINKYFDNLEETLANVPPENFLQYDETGFTDDPKAERVLTRKGTKHTERIMDVSKTNTSVMVTVTGSGVMLPPYTVYQAKNLYPTWIENGLPGSRFNRTKSGWFDMQTYEDWFQSIALPYLKKLPGKKVILGDNLASHISIKVVKECEENDISYVLLPPNSTHLLQPLDVSFFRPMKLKWREALTEWKFKNKGCLPKAEFPSLLKLTVEKLGENISPNIKAGFKACGLIPLDRQQVLKRLPQEPINEEAAPLVWCDTLIQHLKKTRNPTVQEPKPRGKKINVPAGKGISVDDFPAENDDQDPQDSASDPDIPDEEMSSDSISDTDNQENIPPRSMNNKRNSIAVQIHEQAPVRRPLVEINADQRPQSDTSVIKAGDHVLVALTLPARKIQCVGKVIAQLSDIVYSIDMMRIVRGKHSTYFTYPAVKDIQVVMKLDIVMKLLFVKELRRGGIEFPGLDLSMVH